MALLAWYPAAPVAARLTRGLLITAAALLTIFTVVRNLPFGSYLGSGLG